MKWEERERRRRERLTQKKGTWATHVLYCDMKFFASNEETAEEF